MQHATSLRGIYGAALAPKPKNVATVSPVIDDTTLNHDEENPLEPHDVDASPFRVHDDDENDALQTMTLQTKSSLRPPSSSSFSTLRFPFSSGRSSNQDDADTAAASAAAGKYAVVGQKTEWRRHRSQRAKGPATIRHVSSDELDTNGEDREQLGERASSYLSTTERPEIPTLSLATARAETTPHSSRFSSGRDSSTDESSSSTTSSSGSQSARELFSVTRQKKDRYAAKLYMPGQNPLYLGRYRSEAAARAACEEAFATITTPRNTA